MQWFPNRKVGRGRIKEGIVAPPLSKIGEKTCSSGRRS
jgi:hypothetical protein